MRSIHIITIVALCAAMMGCEASRRAEVQTALDAVQAASAAARAELPKDAPVARSSLALLDVAVQAYQDIRWTEAQGEERWQHYLSWIRIAARTVAAVVDLIEAAGVDLPDAIVEARAVLARYLQ